MSGSVGGGTKTDLVAAIDFGTTYSGYAYSTRDDYERDKLTIYTMEWKSPNFLSLKTPTTVLLDRDKKLEAFGYDAESRYTRLAENDEHHDYYYFRQFKMVLYNEIRESKLTMNTTIPDINQKRLPAIDVFSHAIAFLQQHLLKHLNSRGTGTIDADKIHWVLTVPAIWDDPAKQFMREAAKRANIPSDNLTIALEPEAASIYCKHLSLEKGEGDIGFRTFQEGTCYLVVDAGGGTVDITLHEIQKDGKIKELEQASGGAWGGTYVDRAFYTLLEDILGREEFERYRKDHAAEIMEIFSEFERSKRTLKPETGHTNSTCCRNIKLILPKSLKDFYNTTHGRDIEDEIQKFCGLTWRKEKLHISHERFSELCEDACDGIVGHIRHPLKSPKAKGTKTILMVGGFSESEFLQKKIETSFPAMKPIVPNEPGLAVLKGAVLFGHNPDTISVRVARFTYGVGTCEKFDHQHHPKSKRQKMNDLWYCKDVFSKHVQKGEVIETDKATEWHSYIPVDKNEKSILFEIFTSTKDDPKYIDDRSCKKLGCLEVDISNLQSESKKSVRLQFTFGGTEIRVVGKIEDTNEEVKATFNFLEDYTELDNENVYLDE